MILLPKISKHNQRQLWRSNKSHYYYHRILILLDIGLFAILLLGVGLLVAMFIDSSYNIEDMYVSDLWHGEAGNIFTITLIATSILMILAIPGISMAVKKQATRQGQLFGTFLIVSGYIAMILMIPVALTGTGMEESWLGPISHEEAHTISAWNLFFAMTLLLMAMAISYIFNAMRDTKKVNKGLEISYYYLMFVVLLNIVSFLADDFTDLDQSSMFIKIQSVIYGSVFVYIGIIIFLAFDDLKKIQHIDKVGIAIGIIIFMDVTIILVNGATLPAIEAVFLYNLLIFFTAMVLNQRYKIIQKIK